MQALRELLLLEQQRHKERDKEDKDQRALLAAANNLNRKLERLVDISVQEKADALALLSSEYAVGQARTEQAARVAAAAAATLKQAAAATKEAAKISARADTVERVKEKMAAKVDTLTAVHREAFDSVVAQLEAAKIKIFNARLDRAEACQDIKAGKAAIKEKKAEIEEEKKLKKSAQARARKNKQRLKAQRITTKAVVSEYRLLVSEAQARLGAHVREAAAEHEAVLADAVAHLTLDLEEAEERADAAEEAKTFHFVKDGADGVPRVGNKRHRFKDEFFDVCVKFLFLGVPPKNVMSIIKTACECFGMSYDALPQSMAPMTRADQAKGVLNQQQAADFMDRQAKPDEKIFFELMHDATKQVLTLPTPLPLTPPTPSVAGPPLAVQPPGGVFFWPFSEHVSAPFVCRLPLANPWPNPPFVLLPPFFAGNLKSARKTFWR